MNAVFVRTWGFSIAGELALVYCRDGGSNCKMTLTKDAHENRTAVAKTRIGALPSWDVTVCPVASSAPNAATNASMARRPLMISGAPLKAMASEAHTGIRQP